MNRVHFKKVEAWEYPEDRTEGCWFITDIKSSDVVIRNVVYLRCPGARALNMIPLHTINDKGEVNASVLVKHDYKDDHYEFHAFIILDDWNPQHYKNANEEFVRIINK